MTPRQREIYTFIKLHIQDKGYPPTIREIGSQFGIGSQNGVVCHLTALKKKRFIDWESAKSRSIRLTNGFAELKDLDGNVHSFAWLFEPGNSIARDGEILDGENVVIGSVMRVGGKSNV
jgi:SOS-response transcriptional repressor LexA